MSTNKTYFIFKEPKIHFDLQKSKSNLWFCSKFNKRCILLLQFQYPLPSLPIIYIIPIMVINLFPKFQRLTSILMELEWYVIIFSISIYNFIFLGHTWKLSYRSSTRTTKIQKIKIWTFCYYAFLQRNIWRSWT